MDRLIDAFREFLVKQFPTAESYISPVFSQPTFRLLAKATIISLAVFLISMLTATFLWVMSDIDRQTDKEKLMLTREWRINEAKISVRKKYLDSLNRIEYNDTLNRLEKDLYILRKQHEIDTLVFYADSVRKYVKELD